MLQNDVALRDVVKGLSEQLQQVQRQFQLQLAEQQAVITEQARQIHALTRNDVKQDQQVDNMAETITKQARQVDRLIDNVARLKAEHKVITALQDDGTGCCMSALLKPFDIVFY